MDILSKLTCGLIPAYYTDTQQGSGPASAAELFTSLDRRAKTLRKARAMPAICYSLALHAGVAGRTIRPEAAAAVMEAVATGGNYGQSYHRIMGIAGNGSDNFLPQNIGESGILNFKETATNHLVHTAYLHRTNTGQLILMHNNSAIMDMKMAGVDVTPLQHGGVTIYTNVDRLQEYLDAGYRFYFTPASRLNAAAA